MASIIPDSHRYLLDEPLPAVLTTMMADGYPQSSIVWCSYDGTAVYVNTTRERQKGQNMQHNPHVTLLVMDPQDPTRFIEVRGKVEISEAGAIEHLDSLVQQYTGKQRYYGEHVPATQQQRETRILCKIRPTRVTCDAIQNEYP